MYGGLNCGAAGLWTSVAASDLTEGLCARSEAAELLPGTILTLHPAPRRSESPRGSDGNQSQAVFLMIRPFLYAPRTAPATCLKSLLTEVDIWR